MKNYLYLFLIIALISCETHVNAAAEKSVVNVQEDRDKLRNIKEVLWSKAYREQDTVLLDQILDESFEFIDGDGNRFTKNDELDWIKKNATAYDSFTYEIKRLEIYDNGTAVVAGTGHIHKNGTYHVYESSNILIKKDTIWKAIASHVSGYRKAENK